jgi:hypothetical protein
MSLSTAEYIPPMFTRPPFANHLPYQLFQSEPDVALGEAEALGRQPAPCVQLPQTYVGHLEILIPKRIEYIYLCHAQV